MSGPTFMMTYHYEDGRVTHEEYPTVKECLEAIQYHWMIEELDQAQRITIAFKGRLVLLWDTTVQIAYDILPDFIPRTVRRR